MPFDCGEKTIKGTILYMKDPVGKLTAFLKRRGRGLRRGLACAAAGLCAALCMPARVQAAEPQDITAAAWVLIDASTGQVLAEKQSDTRMYPASITKILTVALAVEKANNDLTQQVTVSHDDVYSITSDSSHIALQEGEVVSLADMAYGAMLASGNDAANVLAEYVCGSLDQVETVYSQKLAELGCDNTHFVNAHGLHSENHYTTAADMAKITKWALSVPGFEEVFDSIKYDMQPTNLQPEVRYFSTADWLRLNGEKYHYDPALGSKNGWTTEAGHTFVALAEKDGRRLICVLMNCTTKYTKFVDAAKLFEYGFNEFYAVNMEGLLPTREVQVQGGGDPLGTATLQAPAITLYLKKDYTADNVVAEVESPDIYTLGTPFSATIHLRLQDGLDGQPADLGSYSMELSGVGAVLTASVGLEPENVLGYGRKNSFDPRTILLYTAVLLGGGAAIVAAWKLGRRHAAARMYRGTGLIRRRGFTARGPSTQPFRVIWGKKSGSVRPSRRNYDLSDRRGDR